MPTLRQYRRELGRNLGFYLVSTLSTGSTSVSTLPLDDLLDSDLESRVTSEVWAFIASSGQTASAEQRRIKKQGLAPGTGVVTMTRDFSATVSSGTQVDVSGVLPVVDALGRKGLHTVCNDALRECWFVDRLAVPHGSTAYQVDLSTVGTWLTNERQIVDVWMRANGAVRDQLVPEWRFLADADTPTLDLRTPISSNDTLNLVVYRPMDTWIRAGGTWAASTAGLSTETDEGLLSLDGMRTVGLALAMDAAALFDPDRWTKPAARQRIKANTWKAWHLDRAQGRDVHWRSQTILTPDWPPLLSSA